jgi:Arc/MetJ family transcription regulator
MHRLGASPQRWSHGVQERQRYRRAKPPQDGPPWQRFPGHECVLLIKILAHLTVAIHIRDVYNWYLGYTSMRTNIVIDDKLMRDALRATGLKTKREAVESGLRTLLRLSKQAEIRRLRGKLKWQGDLDAMRTDR